MKPRGGSIDSHVDAAGRFRMPQMQGWMCLVFVPTQFFEQRIGSVGLRDDQPPMNFITVTSPRNE